MRTLIFTLIAASAFGQGRVIDRQCEIASRRSARGGVACSTVCPALTSCTPGVTNKVLRSAEFDNAVWLTGDVGSAGAPTVTANYALAPDGTMTADRIQFQACSITGQRSEKYQQLNTGSLTKYSNSLFLTTTAATVQHVSACSFGADAMGHCTVCDVYPLTCAMRCGDLNFNGSTTQYFIIGCNNAPALYTGASNTGAADVVAWGAQQELGPAPTGYVPTLGTAATCP